jgi:hypothetical protein
MSAGSEPTWIRVGLALSLTAFGLAMAAKIGFATYLYTHGSLGPDPDRGYVVPYVIIKLVSYVAPDDISLSRQLTWVALCVFLPVMWFIHKQRFPKT